MRFEKIWIKFRKIIAKIRVYWWVFRHPKDIILFNCMNSADHWLKAEDAKIDSDGNVIEWIDHRKARPDWYIEIVGEKIQKELEIICSDKK